MTNKVEEIRSLTGLRFFAAFHVVLYHNFYLLMDPKDSPRWIQSIVSQGHIPVSFFFLLSGFILTYVYSQSDGFIKGTKKGFWKSRFARLYPLYLFAFTLDLPRGLAFFYDKYDFSTASFKTIVSGAGHLSMIQSWIPRITPTWNSPAWSLSCEAFFYLCFPFLIPILWKIKRNSLVTLSLILYLTPISFYFLNTDLLETNSTNYIQTLWRSFPPLRFLEFVEGILLGRLFLFLKKENLKTFNNNKLGAALFWSSIIILLGVLANSSFFPQALLDNNLLLPVFSVMIISLALFKVPGAFLLEYKLIHYLGLISYGIYILHQPIKYYAYILKDALRIENSSFYFFLYIFMTLSLSAMAYHLIESPMRKWIVKRK